MPTYIRAYVLGGTFFFTPVTYQRYPLFRHSIARRALREAIQYVCAGRPFTIHAFVLMPDHLHMVWTLPPGDADFSTRWRLIKHFTTRHLSRVGLAPSYTVKQSPSRLKKHERPIWQRRFWEHVVRDEKEFATLCDYIHYNPVKHGYARCPHAWSYSSFHRFVQTKLYPQDWLCVCKGIRHRTPGFGLGDDIVGE
ncbi:MAG: transposase [Deltaproteobacteria bacterium]|nr:transposase [Deltaproteobacteria bacterium]